LRRQTCLLAGLIEPCCFRGGSAAVTPEERSILSQIHPEDDTIRLDALGRYSDELVKIAIAVSLRNPFVTIQYFLTNASFIFQVIQPPGVRLSHVMMIVNENQFGFRPNSKLPIFGQLFRKIIAISEMPAVDWLFWRNAFWMYLLVFAGTITCIRLSSWKYYLVIIPVLLNALPLTFLVGSHISRYIFPTLLVGPLFGIGLLFMRPKVKKLH